MTAKQQPGSAHHSKLPLQHCSAVDSAHSSMKGFVHFLRDFQKQRALWDHIQSDQLMSETTFYVEFGVQKSAIFWCRDITYSMSFQRVQVCRLWHKNQCQNTTFLSINGIFFVCDAKIRGPFSAEPFSIHRESLVAGIVKRTSSPP